MPSLMSRLGAALRLSTKAAEPLPLDAKGMPPSWAGLMFMGGELNPRQAWQLYKQVATLAKVVDLIADQVAFLTPTLEIGGQMVEGHEILDLLAKPGYNRTRRRLIKELVVEILTSGAAYPHIIGNTGFMPVAIDLCKAQNLVNQEGDDGWPVSFLVSEPRRQMTFVRDGTRDFRFVDGQFGELLPIYDMAGDYKGIGFSRLQAVRNDVELRLRCIVHNRQLIDKGARLSGVLSFKESLTPDQMAAAERQVQDKLSGVAGGVFISAGGDADFTSTMMTPRDMDWDTLTKLVDDAVIARYNVPVTLFNVDAQTNNNYETAWRMLYDNAVMPTFEIVYDALARMFSQRLGYDVAFKPDRLAVTILADQAVARAVKLHGAGLVTRNESRHTIGMEPSLGGDQFYVSAGMIPDGEDFFTEVDRALGPDPERRGGDEDDSKPVKKPAPKAKDKTGSDERRQLN